MTDAFAIEAEGLRKSYGEVRALAGVDLRVPTGTVLGLLGPNGAGKTTAVRILRTLLPPDGGTARTSIWGAVAWSVGLIASFAPLCVSRYRRALTS